ncbi:tautomerase family protein [Lysobacter cavernae]|uniref:Tautomerase family protein n=1 Tax=Lysobacter cavernae TaxID=1685901 RepID=A0ABV7RP64_9GAMM
MPLVRIDLLEGKSDAYCAGLGEVIYEAMRATLNVPENDRFQIVNTHPDGAMAIDGTYLGIERSRDCVVIQVTLNHGRSVAMKRAFYRAVADGLHARLGLRREDVFISLVEVAKENWSFGNGEAQYADP